MKFLILFALVATASARSVSISSCIPSNVVSHAIPPPSLTVITSAASVTDPSLQTDIRVIEAITVSSPSFGPVESEIESYERTFYSTVSTLESYIESPSVITNPSYFTSLVSHYPTLAAALTELVSVERSHPSLSDIQSSLQDAMVHYTSIVTVGERTFDWSYASLRSDDAGISKVAVATPSIVTDVDVVTTAIVLSPSLSSDFDLLDSVAVSSPSAIYELTTARDWTDTDAWYIDSTLKSLAVSSPSLETAVTAIDSFLATHQSAVTGITAVISVLTSSPSIISQVTTVQCAISTTFTHAISALSPAVAIDSHITTEVTYLDLLEATSPTLSCAEGTIERDIQSEPSTVALIEQAIASPSAVTNPTQVISLEDLYPSIVTAVDAITFVESSHPTLIAIQTSLQSVEVVDTTVLTDAASVMSGTSPSILSDADDLEEAASVYSSIAEVIASFTSITSLLPSLSCAESIIAQYASSYPSIIKTLSEALSSPSTVAKSSVAYIAELTAEYPSLASALLSIDSAEVQYSSLATIEPALTFVLTYEPEVVSAYTHLETYATVVSKEVCSFEPSAPAPTD